MSEIELRSPESDKDWEAYFDLRFRTLREPWGQPRGSERYKDDPESIHVMAVSGEQVVGVGRAHFNSSSEAQFRLMAVDPEFERQGIGRMVLLELERIVKEKGAKVVILDARDYALDFYLRNGYEVFADSYLLFDTIQHYKVRKEL